MARILSRKFAAARAGRARADARRPAAQAGVGDLLVAPTRVVLDGRRGTEVILNNIGDDVATYRVTAELRRMTPEGNLVDVTDPNAGEKAAQEMLLYAPRRITLPPNQPQAIRLTARAPEGLPDGEYRVHMLFRAIPPPRPQVAPQKVEASPSSCARSTASPFR